MSESLINKKRKPGRPPKKIPIGKEKRVIKKKVNNEKKQFNIFKTNEINKTKISQMINNFINISKTFSEDIKNSIFFNNHFISLISKLMISQNEFPVYTFLLEKFNLNRKIKYEKISKSMWEDFEFLGFFIKNKLSKSYAEKIEKIKSENKILFEQKYCAWLNKDFIEKNDSNNIFKTNGELLNNLYNNELFYNVKEVAKWKNLLDKIDNPYCPVNLNIIKVVDEMLYRTPVYSNHKNIELISERNEKGLISDDDDNDEERSIYRNRGNNYVNNNQGNIHIGQIQVDNNNSNFIQGYEIVDNDSIENLNITVENNPSPVNTDLYFVPENSNNEI